jgi:hypothetical protein
VTHVTGLLASGAQPESVVSTYLQANRDLFGLSGSDLLPLSPAGVATASPQAIPVMYEPETKKHKFLLYKYVQHANGIPVVGGGASFLVRNESPYTLVHAGSTTRDLTGFVPVLGGKTVDMAAIKQHLTAKSRAGFAPALQQQLGPKANIQSEPEGVIWAGREHAKAAPRLATTYVADTVNGQGRPDKIRVVADLLTGEVLDKESLIVFESVQGQVQGVGNSDSNAAECSTAAALAMPYATVTSSPDSLSANADASGNYVLSFSGVSPETLTSQLRGTYFTVSDYVSSRNDSIAANVVPPQLQSFLHNETENAYAHAQVNGYFHANRVRNWVLSFSPSYPVISTQTGFSVVVDRNDGYCPGNAWYDGSSLNCCEAGSDYGNTAFGSVIHHEYGHHVVSSAGSGQGEYGEGMADAIAMLYADDPRLGLGFFAGDCTNPLRTGDNTCQYSSSCSTCGSEIHACGQLLAGAIWSVRNAMQTAYPSTYRQILGSLTVASIHLHSGTAINSQIPIDFLTLDDDDGDIYNGTPHRAEICSGFGAHGLACPALHVGLSVSPTSAFAATGAPGGPFLPASTSYTLLNYGPSELSYTVSTTLAWLTIDVPSGTLANGASKTINVSINSQANSLAADTYTGTIVFTDTTTHVGDTTRTVTLTVDPNHVIYAWSLDTNPGWTLDTGWEYGTALGNLGDPTSGHTGTEVLGTYLSGAYPNNMPESAMTTGAINCSQLSHVHLKFWRWLGVESNVWDHARVYVSNDGTNWTTVWQNSSTAIIDTDWSQQDYDISAVADGRATVYVRWSLGPTDGSVTYGGWNIDDIEIWGVNTGPCTTDANCDDGLFCNGAETCVSGTCTAGTALNCNDSVACTVDACSESAKACAHTPQDSLCDDGLFCNGTETCSATQGCQTGTAPSCADSIACTADTCSESAKACTHTPQNSLCDDGLFCNGGETCSTTQGCVAGAAPCAAGACDETNNVCLASCTDVIKNGSETDIDCGGGQCPVCANGKACLVNSDCQSSNCQNGICQAQSSGLTATLTTTTDWGSGYCMVINITNGNTLPTTSWQVGLDFKGTTSYTTWNGVFSGTTGPVTVGPVAAWNAVIPSGASQNSVGFCANRPSGNTDLAAVTSATGTY